MFTYNLALIKKTIIACLLLATCFVNHAFSAPKIDSWTTDNGLKILFVPINDLAMLDLRLTFAGGSAYDDKSGTANLVTSLLDKGAAAMSADMIAESFESVGAQYSAGSAKDMAWISLRTLSSEAEKQTSLDTWLQIVKSPKFPKEAVERVKKQLLVGLNSRKQDPGAIASETFYKNLYPNHPYGRSRYGTEATIEDISISDLQNHYERYFVAKNGQLSIVGNLSKDEAKKIAKRVASNLKEGENLASLPPVKPLKEGKTIHIPFPSKQANIMMGQIGSKRGDKDYFQLYLGNHGLGGSGFTSQLVKEIRVKRGLSYSVYSYFSPMREYGPFLVGLQTKLENEEEAIKVVRDVLGNFVTKGPSENVIKASKQNISGSFPLRTASNKDILGYIAMIGFYGLPLDYLDKFTSTVNDISHEQVSDAFKRRIDTNKFLTVVVGGDEKK